jgi:hypothetical protein
MGLRINLANSSLPAGVRQLNVNEQRQVRYSYPIFWNACKPLTRRASATVFHAGYDLSRAEMLCRCRTSAGQWRGKLVVLQSLLTAAHPVLGECR